jgi:peroxiredoxin
MVYAKIIAPMAVLFLPLAGLLVAREAVWVMEKSRTESNGYFLQALGVEVLYQAPPVSEFSLETLEGKRLRLLDFRGKVVLLNFWATWCPSCKLEMPSMEALHKRLGHDGLMMLAVNVRESAEEVKAFFEEHQLSFSAILDPEGHAFEQFNVWSLPTTFIIGRKGELLGKVIGYRDWNSEETIGVLKRLLENPP